MVIIDCYFIDECPDILLIVFCKLARQIIEESHHFIDSRPSVLLRCFLSLDSLLLITQSSNFHTKVIT